MPDIGQINYLLTPGALGSSGAAAALLLVNDTDTLLLETGDRLLLEAGGANTALANLSAVSSVGTGDLTMGVQSTASVKITSDQLKTYVQA